MKFQEKKVTKYGNSKIINTPDLEIDEVVYLIDKEMLEFIRGISNNQMINITPQYSDYEITCKK